MLWIMFFWSTPHLVWASRMWRACYNTQKLPSDLISMKWNRGKIWETGKISQPVYKFHWSPRSKYGPSPRLWVAFRCTPSFYKIFSLKMFLPYFFFYLLTDGTRLVLVSLFPFYFSTAKGLTPLSDFLAYCVLSEMLKTTKNKDKLGR